MRFERCVYLWHFGCYDLCAPNCSLIIYCTSGSFDFSSNDKSRFKQHYLVASTVRYRTEDIDKLYFLSQDKLLSIMRSLCCKVKVDSRLVKHIRFLVLRGILSVKTSLY